MNRNPPKPHKRSVPVENAQSNEVPALYDAYLSIVVHQPVNQLQMIVPRDGNVWTFNQTLDLPGRVSQGCGTDPLVLPHLGTGQGSSSPYGVSITDLFHIYLLWCTARARQATPRWPHVKAKLTLLDHPFSRLAELSGHTDPTHPVPERFQTGPAYPPTPARGTGLLAVARPGVAKPNVPARSVKLDCKGRIL